MRLEPRAEVPLALRLGAPLAAVALALLLSALPLLWAGAPVLAAYARLLERAAGSPGADELGHKAACESSLPP